MGLDFYLYIELDGKEIQIFSKNITHNLNTMAEEAGLYLVLWRPTQSKIDVEKTESTHARDLIPTIETGLKKLKNNPEIFKQYNPPNGYGTYEYLVEFTEAVLAACKEYPSALVRTWI